MVIFLTGLLVAALAYCALQAVLSRRLILSALWLAGASALLSVLFYLLGAYLIAVIELSVGAGLVTVLFAFAISIAGEEIIPLRPLVPRVLGGLLALAAVLLIGRLSLPVAPAPAAQLEPALPIVIWDQRGLDILVQMVLIFAGVLGLLGLLAEVKAPLSFPAAAEYAEKRQRELEELQEPGLDEELEKELI
jgi:NADH:ubiquinone oxidoreductase subunit 6 (subunit J)